jgi:hypothetical protein
MAIYFVPLDSGFAQDARERWAFGVHAGGNTWFNDYNKRVVGEGGGINGAVWNQSSIFSGLPDGIS